MTDQTTEQQTERSFPEISVRPDGLRHGTADHHDRTFELKHLTVSYGDSPAVKDVSMDIYHKNITALIGPSGCGKSTLIRCLNRMNDLIPTA